MDPAATLGRRDALNAVATCFMVEVGEIRTLDFEGHLVVSRAAGTFRLDAVLSTLADGQGDVRACKIGDEELTIGAALGSPDFDGPFHILLLHKGGAACRAQTDILLCEKQGSEFI